MSFEAFLHIDEKDNELSSMANILNFQTTLSSSSYLGEAIEG